MKSKITKARAGSPALIFLSTFPSEKKAQKFAKEVVSKRYAACVNVLGPLRSFYRWEGKLNNEIEFLAIGKSTATGFKKIKSEISKLHPYKVPELIAFKISDGHPAYLEWIKSFTM